MTARHSSPIEILCRRSLSLFFVAVLVLGSAPAHAQGTSEFQGIRRSVATVIFAGLGGAVLGLSTLSFYGRPQDHTGNIYAGLGVGLIAGLGYVMMTPDSDMLAQFKQTPKLGLSSFDEIPKAKGPASQIPLAAYSWNF